MLTREIWDDRQHGTQALVYGQEKACLAWDMLNA